LDLIVYIVAQLISALGLGIYSTVSWAMMGDAIDYNEWKTGKREEGTVYALHSFFRKLAQGIGPAVAVTIMATMGYVNNAIDPKTGAEFINVNLISWEHTLQIRSLVAVLYLVAGIFIFVGLGLVYNLDKKTLEKMNAELAERHAAE
jgi:GPH family glycoside/pentoside/hexuronide:cation symporter